MLLIDITVKKIFKKYLKTAKFNFLKTLLKYNNSDEINKYQYIKLLFQVKNTAKNTNS